MGYWGEMALNILLFIPLDFLLGEKRVIVVGFALNTRSELTQYVCLNLGSEKWMMC